MKHWQKEKFLGIVMNYSVATNIERSQVRGILKYLNKLKDNLYRNSLALSQ